MTGTLIPTIAPYGTWASPIDAAMVAAGAKPLSSPAFDGDAIVWIEGVPAEGGRMTLMRDQHGRRTSVTPAPFNLRTRVHEYGGGAFAVDQGIAYFSNFIDNAIYRLAPGTEAVVLTDDRRRRYADLTVDRARQRLLCVCEDHRIQAKEPRASLVALNFEPGNGHIAPPRELVAGHDFYAAPRLSPDGGTLAWLCWNHPLMPWDGAALWIARVADDGALVDARHIAGGADESLCMPVWSPAGVLHVVSDRTGWWNIHRVDGEYLTNVCPMDAEFGVPAWEFGESLYGFSDADTIIATSIRDGACSLLSIDARTGAWAAIDTGFSFLDDVQVGADHAVALAASETTPIQAVCIDLASGHHRVLSTSVEHLPSPRYLSTPRRIRFASADGRNVSAVFYPPKNDDWRAPTGECPPVIVQSHGGPTTMTNSALRLGNQFWTSRGFAVLDVDYGGSSGYGRAFREVLRGRWGIVDVEDCVAAALYVANHAWVDRDRMAIRGGSASGFTTLCALAFHDVFKAGASAFGVADLATFVQDTHKFESRYADFLFGPAENHARVFADRSPYLHADRIRAPMIFFQGMDDRVVPPSQSETMVRALRERGIPVAYLPFEGEGHGFRRFESLRRIPEAELDFYSRVFGFVPADRVEPVEIDGLPAPTRPPAESAS